jgi:hypothetical protein
VASKAIIGIVIVVIIAAGIGGFLYYRNTASDGHMAVSVADAPVLSGVTGVYIYRSVQLNFTAVHQDGRITQYLQQL